jgi:hypothetical protein
MLVWSAILFAVAALGLLSNDARWGTLGYGCLAAGGTD